MIDPYLAKLCQADFLTFARTAYETLNPADAFDENWHQEALAFLLYEMHAGVSLRAIVSMPPRTLKSFYISVAWTGYLLGQDPTTKIMVLSYAEPLARQLSDQTRRLMQSSFYRQVFPGTELVKQTSSELTTRQGGARYASSMMGSVKGMGASWLIIDDPISATDVNSEVQRKFSNETFATTVTTRLNDPRTDRIIVVQQRLHEDDLSGVLLAKGGWRHLKLQARATEDAEIPIGPGKMHHVRAGDYLHPVRLTPLILAGLERDMGAINYAAQYQQEPVPASGNSIQRSWLRYYPPPPPLAGGAIIQSWDTATKTDPNHDFSVCLTFVKKDNLHYLHDVWRGRVNFPDLRKKAIEHWHQYGAQTILIEDQGAGSSLIQDLKAGHGIPAVAWRSKDPKDVRLAAASSYTQSGQLLLPQNAHWLAEFESELLGFPAKKHDDQVDALSQYFGWVRSTMRLGGFECDWGDDYAPNNHSPHIEDLPYLLSRYR